MSRYIIYCIWLFAIAIFLSQSYADENRWINYYDNYYYDASGIKCNNKICKVWLKLLVESNSLESGEKPGVYIKDTIYAVQLNCRKRLITNSIWVIHRQTDGTSETEQFKIKWFQIKPESRDEKLFNIVCTKGGTTKLKL